MSKPKTEAIHNDGYPYDTRISLELLAGFAGLTLDAVSKRTNIPVGELTSIYRAYFGNFYQLDSFGKITINHPSKSTFEITSKPRVLDQPVTPNTSQPTRLQRISVSKVSDRLQSWQAENLSEAVERTSKGQFRTLPTNKTT